MRLELISTVLETVVLPVKLFPYVGYRGWSRTTIYGVKVRCVTVTLLGNVGGVNPLLFINSIVSCSYNILLIHFCLYHQGHNFQVNLLN